MEFRFFNLYLVCSILDKIGGMARWPYSSFEEFYTEERNNLLSRVFSAIVTWSMLVGVGATIIGIIDLLN